MGAFTAHAVDTLQRVAREARACRWKAARRRLRLAAVSTRPLQSLWRSSRVALCSRRPRRSACIAATAAAPLAAARCRHAGVHTSAGRSQIARTRCVASASITSLSLSQCRCSRSATAAGSAGVSKLRWELGAFTALADDAHRGVVALGRARTCQCSCRTLRVVAIAIVAAVGGL